MQTINELQCKKQKVFIVGFWLLFRLVISREQTVERMHEIKLIKNKIDVVSLGHIACTECGLLLQT